MGECYSIYKAFLNNKGPPDDTDTENQGVPCPGREHRDAPRGSRPQDVVGVRLAHCTIDAVASAPDVAHESKEDNNEHKYSDGEEEKIVEG